MNNRTILSSVGIYLFLTVVVPISTMVWEFGAEDGWMFISLYSPLFLYPIIFGIFVIPAVVRFATNLAKIPSFAMSSKYILALILIAGVAAFVIEFSGKPAVFEYAPASIGAKSSPPGVDLIEHVRSPTESMKQTFEQQLDSDSWFFLSEDASTTKFAYALSYFVQTLLAAGLIATFAWCARTQFIGDVGYRTARSALIPDMLWIVVLMIPWFLMRMTFEEYKAGIYVDVPRQSVVLSFPFLFAATFLAYTNWQSHGTKLESALGIIAPFGALGLMFQEGWLQALFPRSPAISHYALMWLIIMLMAGMFLLPRSEAESAGQAPVNPRRRRQRG